MYFAFPANNRLVRKNTFVAIYVVIFLSVFYILQVDRYANNFLLTIVDCCTVTLFLFALVHCAVSIPVQFIEGNVFGSVIETCA